MDVGQREWLVVIDIDYYPWPRIVQAATAEDAVRAAGAEQEATGVEYKDGDPDSSVVFVAPLEAVTVFGSQRRVQRAREDI